MNYKLIEDKNGTIVDKKGERYKMSKLGDKDFELYINGIVKDSKNNIEKYLFSENERLNSIIDDQYDKLDAQDKIINTQALEIARLKEVDRKLLERIDNAIEYINKRLLEVANEELQWVEMKVDEYNKEYYNLLSKLGGKDE